MLKRFGAVTAATQRANVSMFPSRTKVPAAKSLRVPE